MIGLGSNRLTVCRRGGMAITQAGRGGMEWLAGFRAPSWASPYSAQATAYLKQHYSAYWSEIADYGRRNPTIVPYINEDPDIVCSLMDVGKVRLLISDAVAYIDTGINPSLYTDLEFGCKANIKRANTYAHALFGVIGNVNAGTDMYGIIYHGTGGIAFRCGNYSSNYISLGKSSPTGLIDIKGTRTSSTMELFVNGVSKGTKAVGTPASKTIYLYRTNYSNASVEKIPTPSEIADIYFNTGNTGLGNFVPFKLGVARSADQVYPSSKGAQAVGTLGMLDLVTGLFHPNANSSGSFSESIETPAS